MSAGPHANAELRKKLRLPDFRDYAIKIERPGNIEVENVPPLGVFLRDVMKWNMDGFSSVRTRREHFQQAGRNLPGFEEILNS